MLTKVASFTVVTCWTALAGAQFAVAPPEDRIADEYEYGPPPPIHESVVRARVGPVLRTASDSTTGGLMTALDFGRRSGLRLSATWTAFGDGEDVGQYGADLWLHLGNLGPVRPVVGAGAALVHRQDDADRVADEKTSTLFGAATVRGGLEYLFALDASDARVSVEALGSIPAIDADRRSPWLTLMSTLALGF